MQFPTELEESLFEQRHFEPQLAGEAEDGEVVGRLCGCGSHDAELKNICKRS
jgi:hypothetical protein